MNEPCIFCGAPAVHWHHPTGRLSPEGLYLDPAFVVPVCRSCHACEHAAWRDVGINGLTDPTLARLCRVVWLIGRLVDLDRAEALNVDVLRGLHGCLIATAGLAGACSC